MAAEACAQVSAMVEAGARPERLLIAHAQHALLPSASPLDASVDGLRGLLRLGVSLCFDGLGTDWMLAGSTRSPQVVSDGEKHVWSDSQVAAALVALCIESLSSQLLISPGVESALQLESCGGGGWVHLVRAFLPLARRRGLAADAEAAIVRQNALRLFCYWTAPPPAKRLERPWRCTSCHRRFVEAVNPAEAKPDDRQRFHKFAFVYCSTACLAAHRRAGFATPFKSVSPDDDGGVPGEAHSG